MVLGSILGGIKSKKAVQSLSEGVDDALLNDEQKKMIESTNLNSNKEVTKLWKELNKSFQ